MGLKKLVKKNLTAQDFDNTMILQSRFRKRI
jgi:hypothetical protein